MSKKRLLISLIPILGSFFHAFYLFLTNKDKSKKSFLAFVCGMISFVVIYCPFGLICNATSLDLNKYIWLVYIIFIIFLNMYIIKIIAGVISTFGFAIIFQPELRKVILHIGQRDWFAYDPENNLIDQVLVAAEILSKRKRGMLIVFKRNSSLKRVLPQSVTTL